MPLQSQTGQHSTNRLLKLYVSMYLRFCCLFFCYCCYCCWCCCYCGLPSIYHQFIFVVKENNLLLKNLPSIYFYPLVQRVVFQIDISDHSNKAPCRHIQHLPIAETGELAVWREGAVIFNIDANTTGLFIATRSITAQRIEASGIGSVLRMLQCILCFFLSYCCLEY